MATSNSTNFNQTRDQICSDALQLIGRLGEGETATSNALSFASNILNKLVKHLEAQGMHLWTTSEGTIFLRDGVSKYTLSSSGDKACDDATLVETELTSDSSGSTLAVTTTVGMTAGDNIGIELDDNTRQWTTIVSVDSTTSVTITDALTGAAGSGNTVFSYTTNVGRVLKILAARCRTADDNDYDIDIWGRTEFMRITAKTTEGSPNVLFYSPNRDDGILHVWMTPNAVSDRIKMSYIRTIQDFDSGSDNPDLPQEWLHALTVLLARQLAPAYGINLMKVNPDLIQQAVQALEELRLWDNDMGSVFVVPDDWE